MTVGGSASGLVNKWLDMLGGTAFSAPAGVYAKLHIGDPGGAGTASPSAETTRKLVAWNNAAAGSKAMNATLSLTNWPAGTETLTHISLWDAASGGTFLASGALATSRTINNGDTFNLTALSVSISPLAA